MSDATEILAELQRRGVSAAVEGNTLRLRPKRVLDDALLARVREHKADMLLEIAQQILKNCPRLPKGVRLLRWEPKAPPVAIDVCSIVVDLSKFIEGELRTLDSRLNNPWTIHGGFSVPQMLDRLRQVGLEVELDPKCGANE